jgi:undecaprenyl-diphosphatase
VAVVAIVTLVVVALPGVAGALGDATASSAEAALTWWKAAILGIVEGLTEYLPISSTGHLLVTARLLDLPHQKGSAGLDAVNTYVIAIQLGAILAVVGVFRRRFVEMLQGLVGRNPEGRHLLVTLIIAFLPAAILGAALDSPIEDALFGPWPVVVAWIVGGVLILVLQRTGHIPDQRHLNAGRTRTLVAITYQQALIIGLAQCIALWPGTSRSLATIIGALLVGVAMPVAVEFSFLLGFATLTAATLFKLAKDGGTLVDQFGVLNPLIGAAFAFVAAVVAIRWLITYLSRHDLTIFAWYRFVVAAVTIILLATVI